MKILVDADACPVLKIIVRTARRFEIPIIMFADTSHDIGGEYGETVVVDKSPDSADFALLSRLVRGDIVVTQDYGLAAMALSKGASVINQNGMVYSEKNIDRLLEERHIGAKIRRGGGRTKGPPKRTADDNARFERAFAALFS